MKCRGLRANPSKTALYAVFDRTLWHIARDGTRTERGTLVSRAGTVDMKFGASQLVIVDGTNGYVLNTQTNEFTRITDPAWKGSRRVGYVKGVFLFATPGTGEFYISAIEDATSLDELDIATASASPDSVVAVLDNHGEAWLLGDVSSEVWSFTGAGDFPLARNDGATSEVGCVAAFSAQTLGGVLYWLGSDESGAVRVYRAAGYQPEPISDDALEQKFAAALRAGVDLSSAIAFAYSDDGRSFYWLQVPGLPTTWVYDAKSQQWHERSDFVDGVHVPHRARHHAYCYGRHILGGDSGDLWAFDPNVHNNVGDPIARDRISPHYASPALSRIVFGPFELDARVGDGRADGTPVQVAMRYSDDGGKTWSDWRLEDVGAIGEYGARAVWTLNGAAFDRVWHVRCVDDAPFAILSAKVTGR